MTFNTLLPYASAVFGALLAAAGLVRPNRTISRWAFAAGMLVLAAESLIIGIIAGGELTPEFMVRWQQRRLITLSLLPGIWILFSLSYARGDLPQTLARWRGVLAAALVLPLAVALIFRSDLLLVIEVRDEWFLRLGWTGIMLHGLLLVGSIIVLLNLERTYRGSVGTMRWRIKFMLMGAGILFAVRVYTSSQVLLFRGMDPLVESVDTGALLVAALLFLRAFFRDNHFNLDVYPSQPVLQNSLTSLLAGVYLLLVGVFAKVVVFFGGDSTFALKAFLALISLVLLALLLQSDRVRLHLRRFVSRHFQRPLYDYRLVWKQFTDGTASCVEQADLCRALVRLVADMFQALSVSIWLIDEQKQVMLLGGSTSAPQARATEDTAGRAVATSLVAYFQEHVDPVDIESIAEPWAVELRRWHPAEFTHGGHRMCVPIIGRGEFLGLFILGDRVGGIAFTLQDFEMLKCAADHAAASLLNVQLSRKLLQAKELEAFQTMAAFFVHDLKNAASTLNLMLKNLPVHFDDPAFRQDALRGIGQTVSHINQLISRLGLLRSELRIQSSARDLNETVSQGVAGLEPGDAIALVKELTPLPALPHDPEQITKVVTNLVLNARESMSGGGQIRLGTRRDGVWAVISVQDSGCGMSADFIARSLFRPFKTTKKDGLGIGMFQSRMIVEAHGGRIEVSSEVGRGSHFQVYLPLPA